MRRFTVRPRPLQSNKRIRVYHLYGDGSFTFENGERVPPGAGELEDCVSWWLSNMGGCSYPYLSGWHNWSVFVNAVDDILPEGVLSNSVYPLFLRTFAYLFIVSRENIVSQQGAHLYPQTTHPNHSQLRCGGLPLLQAIQWIHQIYSSHSGGGGQPSWVQSRSEWRGMSCFKNIFLFYSLVGDGAYACRRGFSATNCTVSLLQSLNEFRWICLSGCWIVPISSAVSIVK